VVRIFIVWVSAQSVQKIGSISCAQGSGSSITSIRPSSSGWASPAWGFADPVAPTEPGSITSQPAHIIDLMPTLLELAGGTYAAAGKGKQLPPLPGKSLLPVFEGKRRLPHDQLYFQLFDHRAIRSDNWKLTAVDGKAWELYDLSTDRSETNDLSASKPALVEELSKEWEKWWETAYGRPYSEISHPTPPEFQRDDREGGAPYVPTAMPSTQEEHSQRR